MSVILNAKPAAPGRAGWLLAITAVILAVFIMALWYFWPHILLQSMQWQRGLNQKMVELLQQLASHRQQAGMAVIGFSLVYGVLHALGPGHGKVVISAFLATHPTRLKSSLQLTFAAALVQGCVAIVLVTLMLGILQLSSRQLHISSFFLEKASYLLVALLGVILCGRALRRLVRAIRAPVFRRIVSQQAGGHVHDAHCGCGHQHVPDATQLSQAVTLKTKVLVVISMGLRPCSGAIMMLLFSKVVNVYWWGVISALVMAAGTALTVSALALLVQSSRSLAVRLSRTSSPQPVLMACISLLGGGLLVTAGVVLWLAAQPMASNGIRPVFQTAGKVFIVSLALPGSRAGPACRVLAFQCFAQLITHIGQH